MGITIKQPYHSAAGNGFASNLVAGVAFQPFQHGGKRHVRAFIEPGDCRFASQGAMPTLEDRLGLDYLAEPILMLSGVGRPDLATARPKRTRGRFGPHRKKLLLIATPSRGSRARPRRHPVLRAKRHPSRDFSIDQAR